jgi:hypothetical protein
VNNKAPFSRELEVYAARLVVTVMGEKAELDTDECSFLYLKPNELRELAKALQDAADAIDGGAK